MGWAVGFYGGKRDGSGEAKKGKKRRRGEREATARGEVGMGRTEGGYSYRGGFVRFVTGSGLVLWGHMSVCDCVAQVGPVQLCS